MEEKEKQLPSWNRRGVAQRRGGRFKDNHFDLTTTRPFGPPLLFQEGSCFSFSFSSIRSHLL